MKIRYNGRSGKIESFTFTFTFLVTYGMWLGKGICGLQCAVGYSVVRLDMDILDKEDES